MKFFINNLVLIGLIVFCVSPLQVTAAQPGVTTTVFNKRFIHALQPMMMYNQLVKQIGTAGVIVKERKGATSQLVHYHWDGGKRSALDATVVAGKVTEARMLAPNGNTYLFDKAGAITEK
ncbi:MAG: hypothetical protein HXX11_02555 [Desulfuromonadales bacterium]|nr:hypothetical protein [Desulfuromonadales bacterium]